MTASLVVERSQATATVWLDRPQVHNALDEELIAALDAAFAALSEDASVRVVVLAGRGRSFCSGADLAWMRRAAALDEECNRADALRLALMLRRLASLPCPTIARVQGAARGGGVGLAAACDLCVCADDASFALTEVRLGLIPAVIGPHVVRAIGARQAMRYFLTAGPIDAVRAREIGLAHEVVPATGLDACVGALCAELLAGGPQAQAQAKRLVNDLAGREASAMVDADTASRIARIRATPEAREGIEAFFGKRPPSWIARP